MSRLLIAGLMSFWLLPPIANASVPGEVKLSLDRYQELLSRATEGSPGASWSRGSVSVSLDTDRGVANVTVNSRIRVLGKGRAHVALVPSDVVLSLVQIGGSNAQLGTARGMHTAAFEPGDSREQSVRLNYVVALQTSGSGANVVAVPLPPMPSSDFSLSGAEEPIEIWPAVRGTSATSGVLPRSAAVVVRWGVGAGGYTIRAATYVATPDASGDGMDVSATFDVDVSGETAFVPLASREVALLGLKEKGKALAGRVSGSWHQVRLSGRGRHTVKVRFRQLIDRSKGQPSVRMMLTGAPIQRVEATVPGKRSVTFDPVVPVTSVTGGTQEKPVTTASANLPPVKTVSLAWTEARAKPEDDKKINAETYQLIRIEEGVIRSKVHIRYDIIRGKTKELPVAIPEGVVLYKAHGAQIEKWPIYAATEDAPRQARVILSRDRSGSYELVLELQQSFKKGTKVAKLPIVKPLGVAYQTGAVALFDGDKVGFGTGQTAGQVFTKGGENDLPSDIRQELSDKPGQVFRHVEAPDSINAPIEPAKVREVRFDARTNTVYTVKEGVLVGRSLIQIDIKTGRRDALLIALPSEGVKPLSWRFPSKAKEPEVATGVKVPEGYTAYELRFTQALEGGIQVDLAFEKLLDKASSEMALPGLRVLGAAVESGALGITAEPGIEVNARETSELRRVDNNELPKAIRLRSDREILLGYTYSRANWALQLGVKRHEVIETIKAIATQAWFETTVFGDGHQKTVATYVIANERQQYLRLETPPEATVLKVFAGGRPVKANQDDGALTIPLPKDQEITVSVVYEVRAEQLGFFGRRTLMAPKADLRVGDVQWLVRTPKEFAVFGVAAEHLKPKSADDYRPPAQLATGVEMLTRLPNPEEYQERLFTIEELRSKGDAPELTLSFASTPGSWVALLLSLLSLILLVVVVRRRAAQEPLGVSGYAALVIALGLLVLKAAGWGLGVGEAITGVLILGLVGMWTWRMRDED